MPTTNTGNKYKSLRLTIPNGTTSYNVAEQNPSSFPDWSEDWNLRDWYDTLVIKRFSPEDAVIEIKLHREEFDWITIEYCDTPTIIDNIIFRDVIIRNQSGHEATFDILFFSPLVIIGEPRRPTELTIVDDMASVTISFRDNTVDDKKFLIERSTTGPNTGFSVIGEAKYSNFNQLEGKIRTWTDTTTGSGITYWYRVRALRNDGMYSKYSDVISVTTP